MESRMGPRKKVKKTKRPTREVKGEWPDEKIKKMIHLVEQRPELWKIGSEAYKVPKPRVWQEVAMNLGTDDWKDCRAKWQNLRVCYKCNLCKLEKKRQDNGDVVKIHWRFFDMMRFISRMDSQQSTSSSSRINLNDNKSSASRIDAEDEPPRFSGISSSVLPDVVKPRKRHVPSSDSSSSMQGIVEQMTDLVKQPDQHSAFGDHIAAELRSLPIKKANILKCRLTRVLVDFWEENQEGVQLDQPYPVEVYEQFVKEELELIN